MVVVSLVSFSKFPNNSVINKFTVGAVMGITVIFVIVLIVAAFVYHRHSSSQMRDELRNIMSQYVSECVFVCFTERLLAQVRAIGERKRAACSGGATFNTLSVVVEINSIDSPNRL